MADWWSPLISAASGIAGVWVGSWLTLRREKNDRRYDFAHRQLEEFYSPFCAFREEIRAKSQVRRNVSAAMDASWQETMRDARSPEAKREAVTEKEPSLYRAIAYDNDQLRTVLIPAYRSMLDLFKDKLWLVENSTRAHHLALVQFVEVWERVLIQAVPSDVPTRMGHDESALHPLYEDAEHWRTRLRERLREGG